MEDSERRPPPEAVAVTGDGALHKLVLREGTGEMPPKHARCLVHYIGRIAETGEVFMDTRQESPTQEPQEIVSGRDSAYRELGLHLAVAGMRCGERCRLWVGPQYGYGAQGSFSFPTVPPNADLVYELELLEFEPPDEEKERGLMTFEERLEAAERRRQDGNALFKGGQTAEALSKYRLALSYINEDLLMQLGDFHFQKALDVKRPTLLNVAACQLRQEEYHAAIITCGEVLAEEPANAKALFRRGRARAALGQSEAAAGDLEKARAAAPEDGAIARELAAVRQALKQERQATGKMFQGYFDKAKDSLYEEQPPAAAAAAAAAGGGGQQQQALLQQRPGGALAAAAHSVWGLIMRGLRALLPFLF